MNVLKTTCILMVSLYGFKASRKDLDTNKGYDLSTQN